MSVINILLWVLFLLVLPALAGYAVCRLLNVRPGIPACFLAGNFALWAYLQAVTVPMTLLRKGFPAVVYSYAAVLGLLAAIGVYLLFHRGQPGIEERPARKREFADWFALALLVLGYLALAITTALLQYDNSDDWQFVTLAVDIDRTNRLFGVFHATGAKVSSFTVSGLDYIRFVLSPWPVYNACIARLTGTHAAIVAHSVMPQSLLLCVAACYWLLAEAYFPESLFARCSFVFLAFLINVFSGHSRYLAENFTIRRLWQGKAVVAGLAVPALYLSLLRIDEKPEGWRAYIVLYLICLSACLMSSTGIIIGGLLCGAAGLVFGIAKRSLKTALKIWAGLLICLAHYGIYLLK